MRSGMTVKSGWGDGRCGMLVGGDGVGLVVSVLSSLTVNCARIDARKWMRSKGSHAVAFELSPLPLPLRASGPRRLHAS